MALGILGAYGALNKKDIPEYVMVGELSLDGGVRGRPRRLADRHLCAHQKDHELIVPE